MKVLVNGQLLEYKDEGSGRVILMLHGWGASLDTFDQLTHYLATRFRVIRLDFPGFGQSTTPPDNWSVQDYVKITRDFLHKLKIQELYTIIAHSFGGRVVIKGVALDYIKPEKIVFIGAAGVKPRYSLKKNAYKVVAKVGKVVTSLPVINKAQPMLRKRLYTVAGSTDYLNADKMKKIFLNTINEDLLPEVARIAQPTLMIWGENDTETPLNDAKLILGLLKHGKLVVIPDAGHFVYIEAFDKVTKELDEFMS